MLCQSSPTQKSLKPVLSLIALNRPTRVGETSWYSSTRTCVYLLP